MNTCIGDRLLQDIPRRVAKFRPDVEKSVDGKKTYSRPKPNTRATVTRILAINVSIPNLTVPPEAVPTYVTIRNQQPFFR